MAARALREEHPPAAGRARRAGVDEAFYADLERDQAERATMSMLVPPQMLNTMAPSAGPVDPGLHRRALRRPGAPVHDPGVQRPAGGLAVAPARVQGLAARGGDVGGRGADPPLPHQGARRGAADLPAVLRALHPDGPGRQPDARWSTSTSSGWRATTGSARCSPTCGPRRACGTWWCPAATWRTCPGRGWRRSWPTC